MPSILFICTANRFRSPLAAAFFRKMMQGSHVAESWKVDSAGTWTIHGLPVLPEVLLVARAYGLDLSRHRSKPVTGELLSAHDLTLVMEAGHSEALHTEFPSLGGRIYLLSQAAEGRTYDIPDLIDSVESMLEIGGNLHELIQTGFENICRLAVRPQEG